MTQALHCRGQDRPGTLHSCTAVLLRHGANITYVSMTEPGSGEVWLYFELDDDAPVERIAAELMAVETIHEVNTPPTLSHVYGKRVIVIGGGAQVATVAQGAVNEADRHNIRGERISVDTIPLVGEASIAEAVRAVHRLPRAAVLVLAGSLMGGEIARAVVELRRHGVLVISLNQVGSVVEVADLVVTDPIQAGVMAVMAIAHTARFDIARVRGRRL